MQYVLTGATGLLGNNVYRELVSRGEKDIKLLLLPNEDMSIFDEKNIDVAYGDICDKNFLRDNIDANSCVIHMAGIIDISSDKKDLMYKVNVNGTKNVADVCFEKGARLVHTSTVHIINPIGNVLTEPQSLDYDVVGDYAKSKLTATKYVFLMIKRGLRATVCYPSGIIGVNDYKISNTGQLILDIINKKITARVSGGYNFVDVRDVARGIVEASKRDVVGEDFILSGVNVSVTDLMKEVNNKLGRKTLVPLISYKFVIFFAPLAELYYRTRKTKPLFTKYSLETLHTNHNFDCTKAMSQLDYKITPFSKTISDTVDFMVSKKTNLINPKLLNSIKSNTSYDEKRIINEPK